MSPSDNGHPRTQIDRLLDAVKYDTMVEAEVDAWCERLPGDEATSRDARALVRRTLLEKRDQMRDRAVAIYAGALDERSLDLLVGLYESEAWQRHREICEVVGSQVERALIEWINESMRDLERDLASMFDAAKAEGTPS